MESMASKKFSFIESYPMKALKEYMDKRVLEVAEQNLPLRSLRKTDHFKKRSIK